jgi:hypothetical protein
VSARTRPRAPWYAALTRRLTLLRLGLPTLLVCTIVVGPGVASSAESQAKTDVARLVAHPTTTGSSALGDGRRDGERRDATAARTDGR